MCSVVYPLGNLCGCIVWKAFEFVVDEGEPIRSTVGVHSKTLDVSFERCYFWSTYNRPWCGKCQKDECLPRPLRFILTECCTKPKSRSEVNRSATAHLFIPPPGCESLRETHLLIFSVPEVRDVSRGTTTSILSWNRRWIPLKFPQFWNHMVWPE